MTVATLTTVQAFALTLPCPFCEARPGELCTDPAFRSGRERSKHARIHIAREKKAGRHAIETLLARNLAPLLEERPGDCAACGQPWAAHIVERANNRVRVTHPSEVKP